MSQETETNQEDLLRAKEKSQCESDEQYIQNYYTKQARRRKRHRQNEKEHLWQAEERLAMTQEDFDIGSTLFRKPRYVGAAAGAAAQTNDPFRQAVSKAKQQPAHQLSSSVKSLAARLDNKKRKVQEKWDDMWQPWSYKHGSCNGASSSKNDSMNGPWLDYNAGVDDDQSWGDKWRAQEQSKLKNPILEQPFLLPNHCIVLLMVGKFYQSRVFLQQNMKHQQISHHCHLWSVDTRNPELLGTTEYPHGSLQRPIQIDGCL